MNTSSASSSSYLNTPLGLLQIRANGEGVSHIQFVDAQNDEQAETELLILATRQLREYFDGQRQAFSFPLAPGGTEFQHKVWRALRQVPYGETASYSDIARLIQQPKAVRAVGAANGRNPLAIVVPCHRIIGAGGSLTGYAGGLERKAWLLNLEKSQRQIDALSSPSTGA